MQQDFKIHLDYLRGGGTKDITAERLAGFLGEDEEFIAFRFPVSVKGTAALINEEVILRLRASTKVSIPCSVCNEGVDIPIDIALTHLQPVSVLKRGYYDFSDLVREEILLAIPKVAECKGNCPQRESFKDYFSVKKSEEDPNEQQYHPFADLELEVEEKK